MLSFGAVVSAMIATSGDESFVMLAYSRKAFFGIKIINLLVGFLVGAVIMALGF
jgi:hypothetical protein